MFQVNNSIFAAVNYIPVEPGITQVPSNVQAVTDSSLEHNPKLLEALFVQLKASNGAGMLSSISNILDQYGHCNNIKQYASLQSLNTGNGLISQSSKDLLENQKKMVKTTAQVMADTQREVTADRTKANFSAKMSQRALQELAPEEGEIREEISVHTSYAKLWARIALAIKNIKEDYVDFYADLMQKYTEMYESFNTNMQGAATVAVTSGDDGNNVNFNEDEMWKGYQKFLNDVDAIDLGSVKNWESMSPEERQSMVTTLEPAFKVRSYDGGIEFNLDQFYNTPLKPSGIDNDGKVSTASYQAWLASFNSASSALQSNMQSFAQRYSQANSTFDNLNKVLSGAIASMAETAKEVLKALS